MVGNIGTARLDGVKTNITQKFSGRIIVVVGFLLAAIIAVGFSTRSYADVIAFYSVADAQLSTQSPTKPNGTDVKMAVCGGGTSVCSVDQVDEKRGVVKFDVTGLSTSVVSAKLRFYVSTKPVPVIQVKQMTTTSWTEGSATWNSTANLPTTSATYASPSGAGIGWYEADVSSAVTGNGNVSFMLSNQTGSTMRIATRESSNKPHLLLNTADQPSEPPIDQPQPPETGAMNIYLGTSHVHTGGFNNHGEDASTAADVFATAKSSGFNFIILTEHSGPTGPVDGDAFYADANAQAQYHSETDKFIGLAGYEYSDNGNDGDSDSGHMTGWGTSQFINASAPGINFDAFYNLLTNERTVRPVFAGFNHPPALGHNASTPMLFTPERREVIVMSELSNKVAYKPTEEAAYYQAFIAELDRGWRVAPTCGLDSHGLAGLKQLETSTKKPCRTGLLATTLTKETMVDAFQQRRIYNTRDINMELSYKVNGFWMGSQVGTAATTANFDINVSDPDTTNAADKITKIDIVGSGGTVLASQAFNAHSVSWQPSLTVGNNKYMFARVYNGERTTHTTVGSPVWFE